MANGIIKRTYPTGNDAQTISGVNFRLIRNGNVVQISAAIGFWWADSSDGYILKWAASGSGTPTEITLNEPMRPFSPIEIVDANLHKRVTVRSDGKLATNEALTGATLRFSGIWLAADVLT